MKCKRCKETAQVALPSHHTGFCRDCFLEYFSGQVERAIHEHKLFGKDDLILVAVSGGKDSLALLLALNLMGYTAHGLHLDLGIPGSSEHARAKVVSFCEQFSLDLQIIELAREGLAIPEVKAALKRPICSVCGKIKRHWFNKAALDAGAVLATGHNLDDETARLLSNTLRWDKSYLSDQGPLLPAEPGFARKVKPFYRLTEFEIANYGFFMGIDPYKKGCPYSRGASFTFYKDLLAQLERRMPGQKLSFYTNFLKNGRPAFASLEEQAGETLALCQRCGMPTSSEICGVCRIKEALESRRAAQSIGSSSCP